MKNLINNKGLTLIEVILSIAIISIIAAGLLNIFGTGFGNVFRIGRKSKAYYQAAGELELSISDKNYNGKYDANSITNDNVEINIFDKNISARLIKSKIGDINSEINENDEYLYIYNIDKNKEYKAGKAFISIDGSGVYKEGDIALSKEILEGEYRYEGKGKLIIDNDVSIERESNYPIKWFVKEGIIIKPGVSLGDDSVKGIYLSTNGDMIANDVSFPSSGKIEITGNHIGLQGSRFSADSDIIFKGHTIDITGSDTKSTNINVKDNENQIIFRVDQKIFLNIWTNITKNNLEDNAWAINENNAELINPRHSEGNKFR